MTNLSKLITKRFNKMINGNFFYIEAHADGTQIINADTETTLQFSNIIRNDLNLLNSNILSAPQRLENSVAAISISAINSISRFSIEVSSNNGSSWNVISHSYEQILDYVQLTPGIQIRFRILSENEIAIQNTTKLSILILDFV